MSGLAANSSFGVNNPFEGKSRPRAMNIAAISPTIRIPFQLGDRTVTPQEQSFKPSS